MFEAAINHNRRIKYLRFKAENGHATKAETNELQDAFEFIGGIDGGGVIVVPAALLTAEEWENKAAASPDPSYLGSIDNRSTSPVAPPAPSAECPAPSVDPVTHDTIITCKPGQEPKPRGRERMKQTLRG